MQRYLFGEGSSDDRRGHWSVEQDFKEQGCFGQVPRVIFSMEVALRVRLLQEKIHSEWLGYLCGRRVNGDFLVDDLVIPEQKVTRASVDEIEPVANSNILGTVHCHPWEGRPSASGTDVQYLRGNHDLTVIVSSTEKYACYGRIEAKCGLKIVTELEIEMDFPGREDWLKEALKRIKQSSYLHEGGFSLKKISLVRDFDGGFGV